ncbi:hypothetical protein BDV39DRAFT_178766 [Aspergillus sergii]|uniref:Uncharacterized protein n=1 Tax=Aspergillus sergii TaxID=1034303 RepID=A0A5N6X1G4_9EURO|nr:hypothetical protein BDV39DRAFT_178766 [Aspergillus sergii]
MSRAISTLIDHSRSTTTPQPTPGNPQYCSQMPTPSETQRPKITVPLPFHMTPHHQRGSLPHGNKVGEAFSPW